jgi:hypothetical protein
MSAMIRSIKLNSPSDLDPQFISNSRHITWPTPDESGYRTNADHWHETRVWETEGYSGRIARYPEAIANL